MGAVVLSLDEARARRRAGTCPHPECGAEADPQTPRHISDEDVLAGEL